MLLASAEVTSTSKVVKPGGNSSAALEEPLTTELNVAPLTPTSTVAPLVATVGVKPTWLTEAPNTLAT